jgi:hypothetical protein
VMGTWRALVDRSEMVDVRPLLRTLFEDRKIRFRPLEDGRKGFSFEGDARVAWLLPGVVVADSHGCWRPKDIPVGTRSPHCWNRSSSCGTRRVGRRDHPQKPGAFRHHPHPLRDSDGYSSYSFFSVPRRTRSCLIAVRGAVECRSTRGPTVLLDAGALVASGWMNARQHSVRRRCTRCSSALA